MKKLLLSLGTIGLVTTPITTLVSCSDSKKNEKIAKTTSNTIGNTTPTVSINDKISNLINKLSDNVVSTKFDATLNTDVASLAIDTVVQPSLVGLPTDFLTLEDGMSASYTVNTAYDATTHAIKLNLKISATSDNNISSTKVITIKGKYDFTSEKAKFHDLTSTKVTSRLIAGISSVNNISDQELGIITPTLADGVTVTYSMVDKTFTSGSPKAVTVHLNHDGQTDIATFNLRPNTIEISSTTTVFNNGNGIKNIYSMISDGHGGAFVGGDGGKLDRVDANGNLVVGWNTKTLLGGNVIRTIISDGHDGFWVGGDGGKLDHIDASGSVFSDWSTKELLYGNVIRTIISDGQSGFWVGGDRGQLDHIDANGDLVTGWSTKRILLSVASSYNSIRSMVLVKDTIIVVGLGTRGTTLISKVGGTLALIDANGNMIGRTRPILDEHITPTCILSDGHGGFFVGGGRKLDHIDAHGDLVIGSTSKTFLGGHNDLHSIVSDGHGGFFVCGNNATLDHVNANGELADGWNTRTLLDNHVTFYSIISDGNGGFFAGGAEGKLVHFIYEP